MFIQVVFSALINMLSIKGPDRNSELQNHFAVFGVAKSLLYRLG